MRTLVFAILASLPLTAVAQTDGDATEDVTRLSKHVAEMRDLLTSRDGDIRKAALERALADPSPTIRGMGVSYALRGYDRLPLHFVVPQGSSIAREDLPSVTLFRIKWNNDGKSLTAEGGACGAFRVGANGQITADRLRLQIGPLCFGAGLLNANSNGDSHTKPVRLSGCEAELAPNKVRDAMEGKLHCPGLSTELPLALPLG